MENDNWKMEHIIRFLYHKQIAILIFLIAIGAILRLYNLNWGAPYYFHPDERNIASSVSSLAFPSEMNPKFFAYGSLPIYTIYFTGVYTALLQGSYNPHVSFENAIVISRLCTSLFSVLLIPLLYVVGKKLDGTKSGLVAAFLATFCVGFIQFAHFGTFEMWLTFFTILLFYSCLHLSQKIAIKHIVFSGLVFGALVAIKVSSLILIFLPFIAILLSKTQNTTHAYINAAKRLGSFALLIALGAIVYVLTNPFVFLDFQSFLGSMRYESGVALGTLPVFYTGEFAKLTPIIYPFLHIYPFLLNPLVTLLFIPAFVFCLFHIRKGDRSFLLLVTCYLLLFLSQAFLYVQWTRYYVPTLPFIILFVSLFLSRLLKAKDRIQHQLVITCCFILFFTSALFAVSYIITVYVEPDTRTQAVTWARQRIASKEPIVSEVFDLGIVPFNTYYPHITLYDFYSLDSGEPPTRLSDAIEKNSYIILPSQRIIKSRLLQPSAFPKGNAFYSKLSEGSGFTKIYETPCSMWCKIAYLGDPVYSFEGTTNVFDRPTLFIFKKND